MNKYPQPVPLSADVSARLAVKLPANAAANVPEPTFRPSRDVRGADRSGSDKTARRAPLPPISSTSFLPLVARDAFAVPSTMSVHSPTNVGFLPDNPI